jgi:hypothetical protein
MLGLTPCRHPVDDDDDDDDDDDKLKSRWLWEGIFVKVLNFSLLLSVSVKIKTDLSVRFTIPATRLWENLYVGNLIYVRRKHELAVGF